MRIKKTYNFCFLLVLIMILGITININITSNNLTKKENIVHKIELAASKTSTITIKNIQNDNNEQRYTYTIKIDGVAGVIKYDINGKEDYMVFNAKGETTLEVKSNDTISIFDVPYNSNYTITQNSIDDYKTQVNNISTYKYSSTTNDTNIVEFKNTSTIVSDNPETSDNLIKYAIIATAILIFLYSLKQCKIKKFTE